MSEERDIHDDFNHFSAMKEKNRFKEVELDPEVMR